VTRAVSSKVVFDGYEKMRSIKVLAIGLCGFVACYVGPLESSDPPAAKPDTGVNGVTEETGVRDAAPAGELSGVPCDVQGVLQKNQCLGCHGAVPSGPMSLLSYDDLVAPGKSAPSRKMAELMVERMRNPARPMPPSGVPASAEVTVIERWIAAGYPRGACSTGDAGTTGSDASVPAIVSQCSSNSRWTNGNEGDARMNPGRACLDCHTGVNARRNRPRAPDAIGGTVYATVREPDRCNGANGTSSAASIVITDANNRIYSLPVNSVGNFSASSSTVPGLQFPIRAKVVSGGKERAMGSPQMTGDCNSCHTERGANGAPGRIYLP
jgi:hypothetical protein